MATRPAARTQTAQRKSARSAAGSKAAAPARVKRADTPDATVLHLPPPSDPDHRRAYTREQVARMLQISERTLTRLINRGEIHTVNIGRRRMISSVEVDRVLRDGASA